MFDTTKVAKRIKEARVAQNLTQMQLADAMGVSYQAVSNWERGNSMPDISKLEELCRGLELSVGELKELAPFLSGETLDRLVRRAPAEDLEGITELLPFLEEETLDSLVKQYKGNVDSKMLEELAPFLSEESLDELARSCLRRGI